MYKMTNGVVYGPLTKVTKFANLSEIKDRTKESNTAPNVKRQEKPVKQSGLSKKLSDTRTSGIPDMAESSVAEPTYSPRAKEEKNYLQKQLRDAILWSEILGKPVCKRRKRSYYGE